MSTTFDPTIFSQMQTGKPYATYQKTIVGKAFVTVLDPFTMQPMGVLLQGNPKKDDTAHVDVWSEMEDLFFRRSNKKAMETGTVIKVVLSEKAEVKTFEQSSDAELRDAINQKYYAFQKTLSGITTDTVLYRMIDLAKEMEKSEKIVGAIEAKLAEVQFKPQNLVVKE